MEYIITRDNENLFTTEFLIINEEKIDWDALSRFSGRSLSLPEIRMFRKRINWSMYLLSHTIEKDIEIDLAAKYFNYITFTLLSSQDNLSKYIISKYAVDLNWYGIIRNYKYDEDFLFEHIDYWKHFSIIDMQSLILNNPRLHLNTGQFNKLALYLKLKD
jgi:hypothetical protein